MGEFDTPMQAGTARHLENADHAVFERLALAVVASANPTYDSVLHTGINSEGKTITAPVDGFSRVPPSSPPHFVFVQHTTTAKKTLRRKWLHGCEDLLGKSSRPMTDNSSDVKKAWELAKTLKADFPTANFTVVLTTNRAVDEKLYSDVQRICARLGLQPDVWDQTRISRWLDTTATGQWLRWQFLRIAAQQVSLPLLRELSRQSLIRYRETLASREEFWIPRSKKNEIESSSRDSSQLLQVLVGESGCGKSVLSAQIFEARCTTNELCFWLPAEYLESSATIEEALTRAVIGRQPDLWPGAANQVLHLVSRESRLTLVVDDVNRTRDPAQSLRKLIAWLYPRSNGDHMRNRLPLHVLCQCGRPLSISFPQGRARVSRGVRSI
jgi:hypothetical protein